jgi:hypothetical protein
MNSACSASAGDVGANLVKAARQSNENIGDICITAPVRNAEAVAAARVLSRLLSEQLVINKVSTTLRDTVRGEDDSRPRLVILAKDSLDDPCVAASLVAAYRSQQPVLGVLPEGLGFRFIGQADLHKSIRRSRSLEKQASGLSPDVNGTARRKSDHGTAARISTEIIHELDAVLPGVNTEEFAKAMFACFAVIALPLSCASGSKQLLQTQVWEIYARLRNIGSMRKAAEDWSQLLIEQEAESPLTPGSERLSAESMSLGEYSSRKVESAIDKYIHLDEISNELPPASPTISL